MWMAEDPLNWPESGARYFATTHWSVVLAAGDTASPQADEALEQLCRTYWYPLYAYVRRDGYSPEDAQDLTQAFFERLLGRKSWRQARRERGRFRSFLLTSLKYFLINEWKRRTADKRGGRMPPVSLDALVAERLYGREAADLLTPDRLYERSWALTLLEQARARLKEEYAAQSKSKRFEIAEQYLPGVTSKVSYAEAARQLGIAEGTLKSDVHRLKQRYRELLRAEIANTVATRTEIAEELRHLMDVLGR